MGSWSAALEAFRKSPAFTDELLLAFIKSAHAQVRPDWVLSLGWGTGNGEQGSIRFQERN